MESPACETVDLTFTLSPDGGWPPCPTEIVTATLLEPGLAQLTGVPLYVDGVSRGDVISVEWVGESLVAGSVVRRGRHSTVRVLATDPDALTALPDLLPVCGPTVRRGDGPAVLAVDVAEKAALEDVLVVLDSQCSMTLTYVVSCLQHRITPLSPCDLSGARSELVDLVGDQRPGEALRSLELEIRGRLVRPDDLGWDLARQAWNLLVDQRPALVVEVADAFDVQAVVRFAADAGLRVAPQSTGHHAAPLGDLSDVILLRTGRMSAVDVAAETRSVRVGAGATWGDVTSALSPHGLAALAGSSPDVGVAGYALGGGYSWLGRRHGLASSSITAVELVTGDGAFHRVDAEDEPELFWAVRGGGANVGIVCALEMAVLEISTVYAGALLFPLDRAAEILPAYELWTRDLDEAATTCVRLLRVPSLAEVPEPLRGNAFVMIDGAVEADPERAAAILAPLRALGPAMDTFAPLPVEQLAEIHLDPLEPVPAVSDGRSLSDLSADVIDVLLRHAGPGVESALLTVDVRHLGGALGRRDPRGGVVDHLPGRFLLYAVGIPPTPEAAATLGHEVTSLLAALEPWAEPRDYLNFREVAVPAGRLYPDADLVRLRSVRAAHDPADLVVSSHPLG